MVRSDDGEISAFYNVCSHHAMKVAEGENGTVDCFRCPYHGWEYTLSGKLRKTTHMKGIKDFRPKNYGLKAIRVESLGPFVFINLGNDDERSLASTFGSIDDEMRHVGGLGDLTFVTSRAYRLKCNWKVFADNYLDGGYHVGYAHPSLANNLDLDSYHTNIHDYLSVQHVTAAEDRLGEGAAYAFLFPEFYDQPLRSLARYQ